MCKCDGHLSLGSTHILRKLLKKTVLQTGDVWFGKNWAFRTQVHHALVLVEPCFNITVCAAVILSSFSFF